MSIGAWLTSPEVNGEPEVAVSPVSRTELVSVPVKGGESLLPAGYFVSVLPGYERVQ